MLGAARQRYTTLWSKSVVSKAGEHFCLGPEEDRVLDPVVRSPVYELLRHLDYKHYPIASCNEN